MYVVLLELDGCIVIWLISFKGLVWCSECSESDVVCYFVDDECMDFVVELVWCWVELVCKLNVEKWVVLVLVNYLICDGWIGNGVGLDILVVVLNIFCVLC